MRLPIEERCLYPEVEKMPREQLQALQLKKLQQQAEYIYARSAFYRKLFQKAGFRPEQLKALDGIRRLPMISKADLLNDQQENPPYGERLCVKREDIVMTILTSGTSGIGQETYAMTRADVEYSGSAWAVWFYRAGIGRGDAVMLTWPLGTNSGPQAAFMGAFKIGANVFPIGMYESKVKIRNYFLPFNPAGILATPTYLTHLTVLCKEMGVAPAKAMPGLKGIFLGTESYPLSWAEEMEEIWDTRLHDLYGSTQQGAMAACTCERGALYKGRRGLMHLDEAGTLYEVIDPKSGEELQPGEVGELVVTNLNRQATPLFRFCSGDRVRRVSYKECDCGRTWDALECSSIARYDDMIKIRSQNVWPETVDEIIFSFLEVEEYNGKVFVDEHGREQVQIRIEFKTSCTDSERKRGVIDELGANLRERTGVRMEVLEAPHGTLERFLFKTRRWTDERKTGLQRVKYILGGAKEE